jgi:hypothetical protein
VQTAQGIKFFCFFFSKKEDSSFSEEKEAKRLLSLGLWPFRPFVQNFARGYGRLVDKLRDGACGVMRGNDRATPYQPARLFGWAA